jgi:hypothetical protein
MASSISSRFGLRHGRCHRRLVVFAGVLALLPICLAPRAARSAKNQPQPPTEAARRIATSRLVEGVDLLKKGQYATALGKFDEAYALVPSPNIHYDRGLAYLGLGQNAAALEAFEAFLAGATRPPEGKREQAQRHRDNLRPRVARVELASDPTGAEVTVDGRAYGSTPLGRTIYLDPGSHELAARIRSTGAGAVERIAAAAGQELKVTLKLAPARVSVAQVPLRASLAAGPAPTSSATNGSTENLPREADSRSRAQAWTIVAVSGGVALLGAGLTFGLLTRHYGNGLTADSQARAGFDPKKEDNGLKYQTLEEVFLTVGAVALVGGVVAYALERRHAARESAASGRRSASSRAAWSLTGAPVLGPALAGARVGVLF